MGLLLITRFTIQEAFHRWLLLAMLLLDILLLAVFALMLNAAYSNQLAHAPEQSNPQLFLLEFDMIITILSVWAAYLLSGALTIVLIINLVIPTDALWHGASYFLIPSFLYGILQQRGLLRDLDTPFTSIQPLSTALFIWAILYCIVLPIIGAIRFQRRDL